MRRFNLITMGLLLSILVPGQLVEAVALPRPVQSETEPPALTPLRAAIYNQMHALKDGLSPVLSILHYHVFSRRWVVVSFYETRAGLSIRDVTGRFDHLEKTYDLPGSKCPQEAEALNSAASIPAVTPFVRNSPEEILLDTDNYKLVSSSARFNADSNLPTSVDISSVPGTPTAKWIDGTISLVELCALVTKAR